MIITASALRDLDYSGTLAFRRAFPNGLDTSSVTPDAAASAGVDLPAMALVAEDPAWLAWLAGASNTDVLEIVAMSSFVSAPTLATLAASTGPTSAIDGVEIDHYAAVRECALRNPLIAREALESAAGTATPSEADAIRANPSADPGILALLPS